MKPLPSLLLRLAVPALCGCVPCCGTVPVASPTQSAPACTSSLDRFGTLDPRSAAVRAVIVSPRVLAAALRVEAQVHRTAAMSVPPDPSIAIALGVPVDGLGGLPVSVSIMQGLAWMLRQDAIRDAADRERDSAARELVATTVAVASEARGLTRALAAAREAREAADAAVREYEARLSIEKDALAAGESSHARIAQLEEETRALRVRATDDLSAERDMELALASLLGVDAIGVIAADEPAIPDADAATSLAVEQARARLARAQAVAATAGSAWGADVRGGLAFQRDLEDRESVGTSIELALPMFRRESEIAAVHADVEAIRAELAEAERATRLAARQACASAERARELQRLAAAGSDAAAQARERIEHAASIGEASRAEVHGARAAEWSARSDAARRRIALATAIAELESLAAPPAHHAESTDLDRRNPHAATSRMESQP
jgi:hypothetical protein